MARYLVDMNYPHVTDEGLNAVAKALATQADVELAYVFGSVARGQAQPTSDLDIAILLNSRLPAIDRVRRQLALMALLEPDTTFPVQIVLLDDIPPMLAYQVVREGVILFERYHQARVDFEVRALKRYFDILPMLRRHHAAQIRRLEEGSYGQRRRDSHTFDAARSLFERITDAPAD